MTNEALGKILCRRAHLTDEPEVVADQHHAAIPVVDGSCQRVDRLHVQVIRRLILHKCMNLRVYDIT